MKIGITGLVVPGEWSFAETLENIKKDSYTAFELALRDEGYFSLESSDAELIDIRQQADDAGVELVSFCPAISSRPKDLMVNDSELRKAGIETVKEYLRIASVTKVDTVLLVLGSLTPDLYYDEAYVNARESLRELAPYAESLGVKLAIEYVWNKFLLSPMEFNQLLDEVDSSHIGFYFDPGNMAVFGYPEHWVRICSKHVMAVHMKDFKREGYQWTPLLQGDVNFPAVMKELHQIGFGGALVSEVSPGIASFEDTSAAISSIMEM